VRPYDERSWIDRLLRDWKNKLSALKVRLRKLLARRLLPFLFLLSFVTLAGMQPAASQSANDINVIQMVDMGDTAFVKTGPQVWAHVDKASQQIQYRFVQFNFGKPVDGSPETFFLLIDPTRETGFMLDFANNMVKLSLSNSNEYQDFRRIVAVSPLSQIPGINRDWWQNEQPSLLRAHNAGITSQSVRMMDIGKSAFVKTGPSEWVEVNKATGAAEFTFSELGSHLSDYEDVIVLGDTSRNIRFKFNLIPRKVEIGNLNVPFPRADGDPYGKIDILSANSWIPGIQRDWWGYTIATNTPAATNPPAASNPPVSSNAPPVNTAPPGMAQLTWIFRNQTGDVLNIRLKSDRAIWPGNNGALAYNSDGLDHKYIINCVPNETICYGVWTRNGGREWGLGPNLDTSRSCQTCCQTCRNGTTNALIFN